MEIINDIPPEIKAATEYCSLCGHPATASWHGNQVIAICPMCAVEALPALAADAIHCNNIPQATTAMKRIELRFWRALALRLAKGKR